MQAEAALRTAYDAKYDVLKFILSLMVVAIHGALSEKIIYPWVRLAVPLFFIMTSYFLFLKLKNMPGEDGTILKRFVIRNIRLYLFWFVILLPLTLYIRRDLYFCGTQGILNFLSGLFFGSTFVASWYITASIIGVCIVFFLSKRIGSFWMGVIAFASFGIVTCWSSYSFLLPEDCGFARILSWYNDHLSNPVCSFPVAIFWIYVGKCFAQSEGKKCNKWMSLGCFLISLGGLYLEWYFVQRITGACTNDSYIMLMPAAIFMFMCIQNINPLENRHGSDIRRASTVIYVTHGSLLPVIGFVLRKVVHVDSGLLNVVLTVGCSIIVYIAMKWMLCRWKDKKCVLLLKNGF